MSFGRGVAPIAVAGAGIAGLGAAIALKLSGFDVAVFEREHALESVGAGIQLGPNATRILERWSLGLHSAVEPEGIELRNARTGALLNTIPLGPTARQRYGAPYVTLLRKDLQAALLSRARELGVGIEYGCALAAGRSNSKICFQPHPLSPEEKERVAAVAPPLPRAGAGGGKSDDALNLEIAGKPFCAAALIGADGLNSPTRRVLAPKVRCFSNHATAWRALLPPGLLPAPFRTTVVLWLAPGAHLVHYPVSDGKFLNAVLVIDDAPGLESDEEASGMEAVIERLEKWAPVPRSALARPEGWRPWHLHSIEPWQGGAGKMQVIGDAWHGMLPYLASGAVMAIEDAAVLAISLARAEGAVTLGLEQFRERRGPRVWRTARRSSQMGRIYHCPQPFDAVRDHVIRAATGAMLLASNDWLYRGPLELAFESD